MNIRKLVNIDKTSKLYRIIAPNPVIPPALAKFPRKTEPEPLLQCAIPNENETPPHPANDCPWKHPLPPTHPRQPQI